MSYGVIQTSLSVGAGNGKQEDVENPRKHVSCVNIATIYHV